MKNGQQWRNAGGKEVKPESYIYESGQVNSMSDTSWGNDSGISPYNNEI